jgi:hypothetical protein
MNRTYKFTDKASLSSDQSTTLAKIILDSPLQIRRKIKKDLGLAVELDSERIRVSHDGRKVGIASFPTAGGEITVVVGPKTDTLRLKALFAALGEDRLGGNQVRFERASWVTPTVRDESDFTPRISIESVAGNYRPLNTVVWWTGSQASRDHSWRSQGTAAITEVNNESDACSESNLSVRSYR